MDREQNGGVDVHTQRRMESSRRVATLFHERLGAVSTMVTGSVADCHTDEISDIDMTAYYDVMPSMEQIESVRQELRGSERLLEGGSTDEGAYMELYYIDGIKHDMVHGTFAAINTQLDDVLVKFDASSPCQKIAEGILKGHVFRGPERYEELRERVRRYPEELAEAMVRLNLKFAPGWCIPRMGLDRGDFLFAAEFHLMNMKSILGCLMGLNRLYHWGEYKRIESLSEKLRIKPQNLYPRIKKHWDRPEDSAEGMQALIHETLNLVAANMPQIDLGGVRKRVDQVPSKT